MDAFAGVVRLDGGTGQDAGRRLIAGLRRVAQAPAVASTVDGGVMAHLSRAGFSRLPGPVQPLAGDSGARLLVDARLDGPHDLAESLGLDVRTCSDNELAAAALERWGEDAPGRLHGDFALALWQPDRRRLVLARDALGVRPLYYLFDGRRVAFSTLIAPLLALPDTPRDLDEAALADFLTAAPQDPGRTLYRHIRRVPPGATVTFEAGAERVRPYWTLEAIPAVRFRSDDDYVLAARERLDRAVASRLAGEGPIASMLSGGFDSAGVTATAARLAAPRPVIALTCVPGGPHPYGGLDEAAMAGKVAALHPNIDWRRIEGGAAASDGEYRLSGLPRRNGFGAAWFEPVFRAAAEAGARTLLTGGLGNHVLSADGHAIFQDHWRSGRWLRMAAEAGQTMRRQGVSLLDLTRSHLAATLEPRALRRWRWRRKRGENPWSAYSLVSDDFLQALDYRARAWASGHDLPSRFDLEGRRLRWQGLMNQHTHDLRVVSDLVHGIERRDPYADRRLVEFTLGLPEDQFWRGGEKRWLARRVLADRLPAALLAQDRRGRQAPEWHAIATGRLDAMAEAVEQIEASPLASRVLDVGRMKALLASWPRDAEAARASEALHGAALHGALGMGGFLRWIEDGGHV